MAIDVNALLGKLLDTMPIWLPVVAIALKLNVPGFTTKRGDK